MDHSYSSCYNHNSIPRPSQARNEPGPRHNGSKRRTHPDALCPLDTSTGQVSENTRETFQSDYFSSSLTRTVADAARGQTAWTGDSQCSQPSMYSNDQRLLYDAHETRDPVNMPYWASMVEPGFGQSSSSSLAPQYFQNVVWPGAATNQDVPSLNFDAHPADLHILQHHSPGNAIYTEQQDQNPQAVVEAIEDKDTVTRIGVVLSNGRYMCEYEQCADLTFARPAELRRHHTTIHAADKPNFWCHVPTCPRSMSGGSKAFHRNDKLIAHVKSMHS